MAGRSGKYYRAGHWVSRTAGGGRRPAAKPLTATAVVGLIAFGVVLTLISGDPTSPAPTADLTPGASASPTPGH